MKTLLIVATFLCTLTSVFAQSNELLEKGIEYHDQGEYDKAIETYQEAIKIDPENPILYYETALSYYYKEDFENAITYSNHVIRLAPDDGIMIHAAILKGNSLDLLGKTQESIDFFEEIIDKNAENYLLYYNLAFNYLKIEDFEKAEENVINALVINIEHNSSHLLLANIHDYQNHRIQTILATHFFLLLEPDSSRSAEAFAMLDRHLKAGVLVDKNDSSKINIFVDPSDTGEFSSAEFMVSLLEASKNLEKNEQKTEEELFVDNTTSLFKILGETNKNKPEDIWWGFYVPLFYEIANSEHIETYCMYISQSANPQALQWLESNYDKLEAFSNWLMED